MSSHYSGCFPKNPGGGARTTRSSSSNRQQHLQYLEQQQTQQDAYHHQQLGDREQEYNVESQQTQQRGGGGRGKGKQIRPTTSYKSANGGRGQLNQHGRQGAGLFDQLGVANPDGSGGIITIDEDNDKQHHGGDNRGRQQQYPQQHRQQQQQQQQQQQNRKRSRRSNTCNNDPLAKSRQLEGFQQNNKNNNNFTNNLNNNHNNNKQKQQNHQLNCGDVFGSPNNHPGMRRQRNAYGSRGGRGHPGNPIDKPGTSLMVPPKMKDQHKHSKNTNMKQATLSSLSSWPAAGGVGSNNSTPSSSATHAGLEYDDDTKNNNYTTKKNKRRPSSMNSVDDKIPRKNNPNNNKTGGSNKNNINKKNDNGEIDLTTTSDEEDNHDSEDHRHNDDDDDDDDCTTTPAASATTRGSSSRTNTSQSTSSATTGSESRSRSTETSSEYKSEDSSGIRGGGGGGGDEADDDDYDEGDGNKQQRRSKKKAKTSPPAETPADAKAQQRQLLASATTTGAICSNNSDTEVDNGDDEVECVGTKPRYQLRSINSKTPSTPCNNNKNKKRVRDISSNKGDNNNNNNNNGHDIQFQDDDDNDGMSDEELLSRKAWTQDQHQEHRKKKKAKDNNDEEKEEVIVVENPDGGGGAPAPAPTNKKKNKKSRIPPKTHHHEDSTSTMVNAAESAVYTRDGNNAPKEVVEPHHDDNDETSSTRRDSGGSCYEKAKGFALQGLKHGAQEIVGLAGRVLGSLSGSESGGQGQGQPPLLRKKVNNNKATRKRKGRAQSVLAGDAIENAPSKKAPMTDKWWNLDDDNNERSLDSAEQLSDSGDVTSNDRRRLKSIKKRGTSNEANHTKNNRRDLRGYTGEAFSFASKGNMQHDNDPNYTPPGRGRSARTIAGNRRTTRSSSRAKKQPPKNKGSPECIDLLDDDTDEESEVVAYDVGSYSSFNSPWVAIGKKLHGPTGCGVAFDKKNERLVIKYTQKEVQGGRRRTRSSPDGIGAGTGQNLTAEISFLAEQVQEARFYHPQKDADGNKSSGGSLWVNDKGEAMGFLAIHATAEFKFQDIPLLAFDPTADAATGKTYIVVEMHADDLSGLLAHMTDCRSWGYTELQAEEAEVWAKSLLTDKKRLSSEQLQSCFTIDEGFISGKDDKAELVVYPFAAAVDRTDIEKAAKDLKELGPVVGISGSAIDRQTESSGSSDNDEVANEVATTADSNDDNKPRVTGDGKKGDGNKAPPGKGKRQGRAHHVTIQVGDYRRLDPGTYLNDTLIDFFIQWMSRHDDRSQVHFFSTHFYTALSEEGVDSVTKWTANKNINPFQKKLIFIPVNKSLHWSLTVVVNCGEIQKHNNRTKLIKEEGQSSVDDRMDDPMPCLFFLDPMETYHKRNKVRDNILKWLNSEWERIHKNTDAPFTKDTMVQVSPKVPYQSNGYDCGVYVCRYSHGMYKLLNSNFSYREFAKSTTKKRGFQELIIQSEQFSFNTEDIDRIRLEMKKLIKNLSEIHASWKKDVAEEKKRKKAANRRKVEPNSSNDQDSSEEVLPALLSDQVKGASSLDTNGANDDVKQPSLPGAAEFILEAKSSSSLLEGQPNPPAESNPATAGANANSSLTNCNGQNSDGSRPPSSGVAEKSVVDEATVDGGSKPPSSPDPAAELAVDEAKSSITLDNPGTVNGAKSPPVETKKSDVVAHSETTDNQGGTNLIAFDSTASAAAVPMGVCGGFLLPGVALSPAVSSFPFPPTKGAPPQADDGTQLLKNLRISPAEPSDKNDDKAPSPMEVESAAADDSSRYTEMADL